VVVEESEASSCVVAGKACQPCQLCQLQNARLCSPSDTQVQLLQPCQLTQRLHALEVIITASAHMQGVQAAQLLQWRQLCCAARHAGYQCLQAGEAAGKDAGVG
jgi:hypothetical protein